MAAAKRKPQGAFRGKSELRRAGCWVTPSEGDLKASATEKIPPGTQLLLTWKTRYANIFYKTKD